MPAHGLPDVRDVQPDAGLLTYSLLQLSGGALGLNGMSDYPSYIQCGIFRGLPLLGRSRRPSRPPVSKHSSQMCTYLSDRMRFAVVLPMLILRTRTMCTGSILRTTLESLSFLYVFSSSSRFVLSMTLLCGRRSIFFSTWWV